MATNGRKTIIYWILGVLVCPIFKQPKFHCKGCHPSAALIGLNLALKLAWLEQDLGQTHLKKNACAQFPSFVYAALTCHRNPIVGNQSTLDASCLEPQKISETLRMKRLLERVLFQRCWWSIGQISKSDALGSILFDPYPLAPCASKHEESAAYQFHHRHTFEFLRDEVGNGKKKGWGNGSKMIWGCGSYEGPSSSVRVLWAHSGSQKQTSTNTKFYLVKLSIGQIRS